MKNEQLSKDIYFNNLCDDHNSAKYECDKLKDEYNRFKQELANIIADEQKTIKNIII